MQFIWGCYFCNNPIGVHVSDALLRANAIGTSCCRQSGVHSPTTRFAIVDRWGCRNDFIDFRKILICGCSENFICLSEDKLIQPLFSPLSKESRFFAVVANQYFAKLLRLTIVPLPKRSQVICFGYLPYNTASLLVTPSSNDRWSAKDTDAQTYIYCNVTPELTASNTRMNAGPIYAHQGHYSLSL